MATEIDILRQRDSAVDILDDKIGEMINNRNSLDLSDTERNLITREINHLMQARVDLYVTQLKAALDSSELAKALDTIKTVTNELRNVAQQMKDVTSSLKRINKLLGVVVKIRNVLKSGG